MGEAVLDIRNLKVDIRTRTTPIRVIDDVSLRISAGEAVALVGESGSGKSVTALSVMRLTDERMIRPVGGEIGLLGRDVLKLSTEQMQAVRGNQVGMVFQDPMTFLNPVMTIGSQIAGPLRRHMKMRGRRLTARIHELLELVRMPNPAQIARSYPHELSGGMRQRVMIAISLACSPKLLIADEPTTALDVTIQAQVLDILKASLNELGTSLLLITHNMGIVAGMCDRTYVMYKGRIVEEGPVEDIFARPQDDYTRRLLGAVLRHDRPPPEFILRAASEASASQAARPAGDTPAATGTMEPLLRVVDLQKTFDAQGMFSRRRIVRAVDGISFDIAEGETLALVGESGSGKSTTGRMIMGLADRSGGDVRFEGRSIYDLPPGERHALRRRMGIVFQDPYSSLNPRKSIGHILGQPLAIHEGGSASDYRAEAIRMLEMVGLAPGERFIDRMPHAFSGGQRQRIAIARALMMRPRFIIADEAVSALDVSVQAQILELLTRLQNEFNLTFLFITHDLAVVRAIARRVAVMYRGRIVETGPVDTVFASPQHEYTRTLLAASPIPDPAVARGRAPLGVSAGKNVAPSMTSTLPCNS